MSLCSISANDSSEVDREEDTLRVGDHSDESEEEHGDGGFSAHPEAAREELYRDNLAELAVILNDGAEGNAASDPDDNAELDRALVATNQPKPTDDPAGASIGLGHSHRAAGFLAQS